MGIYAARAPSRPSSMASSMQSQNPLKNKQQAQAHTARWYQVWIVASRLALGCLSDAWSKRPIGPIDHIIAGRKSNRQQDGIMQFVPKCNETRKEKRNKKND